MSTVDGEARAAAWRCAVLVFALALACVLTGCGTARFYTQAIRGQTQMLFRQHSIPKLLANTNTPPRLAERLQLALSIRNFAEQELGLPANGHYLTYADLQRPFAVWNVYAAPEFSLKPRSWWYPVVGRLDYRGYFAEADARRLAARLVLKGNDVYVGGVQAYSTLGWFRDPVLNTFIHDADADLAELLLHELAHQRLFVPGDTDFNEAFATAVAEEGVRRWLRSRGPNHAVALLEFENASRRKAEFVALLNRTRTRLTELYPETCPPEGSRTDDLRRAKSEILNRLRNEYATLKAGWGGASEFDPWFKAPLNNARLNTVEAYFGLVPAFRQLLAENGGDLGKFYQAAKSLGRLETTARQQQLQRLAAIAATRTQAP